MDYCESVYLYYHRMGFQAELDRTRGDIKKRIRNAQLAQYNYILVAGEDEMKDGTVNVRTREMKILGKMRVDKVGEMFKAENPAPSLAYENFYKKAFDPKAFFGEEAPVEESKGPSAASAAAPKQSAGG